MKRDWDEIGGCLLLAGIGVFFACIGLVVLVTGIMAQMQMGGR